MRVHHAREALIECDTAITPTRAPRQGSQTTPTNFNTENLGARGRDRAAKLY